MLNRPPANPSSAPSAADASAATVAAPLLRPTLSGRAGNRRESLSTQLLRQLSDNISNGRLKPGDRLPSEQALCDTYGVSRAVVREAMSSLRTEGLVCSFQGKGVFVQNRTNTPAFRVDPHELDIAQQVIKMLELRLAIEAEGAALAATCHAEAAIAHLRSAYDAMGQAIARGDDAIAQDLAFIGP